MKMKPIQSAYKAVQLIKLMSSTQTITEIANSIQVKDIITFSINTQFLNTNFTLIKQCLTKIQELQGTLGKQQSASRQVSDRLKEAQAKIKANQDHLQKNEEKVKELQNNVGDQFMKRMYGIEEKTKNMFAFEDTVSKLIAMNKFVTIKQFNQTEEQLKNGIQQAKMIKNQFERYVQKNSFEAFKQSNLIYHQQKQSKIKNLSEQIEKINNQVLKAKQQIDQANANVKENGKMIKEINFPEMMEKLKKFRQDTDQKMNDLILKMKKKVGSNQLLAFEQTMIQRLDKFLSDNEKGKAQKEQTRQALLFLQKRISDIEQIFAEKANEQEKDALFSIKKWQCASCTKDLGKYEGKLGQYKPWSIFPCKELDPEKTGGFGYMSYLDKVSLKKLGSVHDEPSSNTERLNRTAVQKDGQSPKRGSSTARTNNLISNYGSEEKSSLGLKEAYYRELKTEKGQRAKFFRVKKQSSKAASEFQKIKEV